jgi:phenylacetate-CoA ligase
VIGAVAWWTVVDAPSTFRAPRLDAGSLRALAGRRLSRLLDAAARAPFYAGRLRAAGIDPARAGARSQPFALLQELPPVSKSDLREAGATALAAGRVDPAWRSSRSSGSTGEPFRVYYEARAWARLKHLVKLRARAACGVRPWDRVAILDALPLPIEGAEREGVPGFSRVRKISVLQPAERVAAELARFAPDVVYGFPSTLLEASATAPPAPTRPRLLFTSGELLRPALRAGLATAYGCPVFDVYGCSETKEIAWECPRGGLHVNADVIHLEVLDASGKPAAPGEEGDLVATLLVNRAMPLLRYRTADRGALGAEPCPCGRALPLLGVVTGRLTDHLELPDGRRLSPYALTCALEEIPGMLRYQVIQLERGWMRVRARLAEPSLAAAATIEDAVHRAAGDRIRVDVEFVERFEAGPNAKFRVVQPAPAANA